MKVEIYADVVCPWCYLGQARFRQALKEAGKEVDVEVSWRPFQLAPDAPPVATSHTDEQLAHKFGGADKVVAAHARMRDLTAAENLPYDPERALYSNTANAHRVIWLAGREGGPELQDAVAERIFRAYHAEGRDIADPATLAELAPELDVKGFLATDEGAKELTHELDRARQLGISGVPFFLFEETWGVSGAQPAEVLTAAIKEVASKLNDQH